MLKNLKALLFQGVKTKFTNFKKKSLWIYMLMIFWSLALLSATTKIKSFDLEKLYMHDKSSVMD